MTSSGMILFAQAYLPATLPWTSKDVLSRVLMVNPSVWIDFNLYAFICRRQLSKELCRFPPNIPSYPDVLGGLRP